MSFNIGSVSADITADNSKFIKAFNQASSSVDKLDKDFNRAQKASKNFSDGLGRLGDFVASGLILDGLRKIGDIAIQGFGSFVKFEDGMAGVTKTAGLTKQETKELGDEILALSPKTKTSIDELQKLAQIGGQFGVPKKELAGFTEEVNKINVALGDDFPGGAEEVGKSLATLKNLFTETKGLGYADAMKSVGSSLNDLGAEGTATAPVIAEFANRIGQLGPALSPSITETMGLGAAFEELGLSAEISSGGLSNILLTAGKRSEEFASQIGISTQAFQEMLKNSPNDALLTLAKSFENIKDDPTKLALAMEDLGIGSQESIKVMSLLAGETDKVREKQDLAKKSFEEATSIQKEYDAVNSTTGANLAKASNLFEASFIKMGNAIRDAFQNNDTLQKFSQDLVLLGQEIAKMDFTGIGVAIASAFGFIVENKNLVIAALIGISTVILAALIPAVISLGTALWAGGIAPIVLAIAGALALLYLAISWVWESNFLGIQEIVGGIVSTLQELWGVLMSNLMPVLNDFWNIMKELWNTFVTAISPALKDLQAELQRLWDVIQPVLIPILNELKAVLIDTIKNTIDTQIKPVLAFLQNVFQAVLPHAINIFNTALGNIKNIISIVASFIQAKGSEIQNIFKNLFQLIGNLIKGDFKGAWENMKNIMKSIGDLDLHILGKQLMQGFINGITSMGGAVMNAAKGIADKAKNAITSALDINSPSRFGIWVGQMTGDGVIGGLDKSKDGVKQSAESLTNSLKSGILQEAIATPTNNMQTINNQRSVSNNNTNNFNISGNQNPMNIAQIIDQRIAQSNRNNRLNSNQVYA